MTTELSACVTLQDGLRFVGTDRSGSMVYLDATAAEGGGAASAKVAPSPPAR
jgi:hypothetical protein